MCCADQLCDSLFTISCFFPSQQKTCRFDVENTPQKNVWVSYTPYLFKFKILFIYLIHFNVNIWPPSCNAFVRPA